jgi:acetyl esterase/lipase
MTAFSQNNGPISTQANSQESAQTTTKYSIEAKPDAIIEYKTIGDVSLSLHIFNPPNHVKSNKTPAIVFFHGGGWKKGDASAFYRQSAYLASRGMVAISAEYRLIKAHGPTPAECVKDAKSAMRFVRSHAGQFGIDPNMLAAGGGSAGGHIAAATGTVKGFNEDSDDLSVSERPDALVLFNPVYDNSEKGYGYSRVKDYWQAISPLHNLDKNTPPTVVFLGTKDQLIPIATAQDFQARMVKLGGRSELHLYKDQFHGFFNKARYYETLLTADKFLTSLGYLKGQATLQRAVKAVSEQ